MHLFAPCVGRDMALAASLVDEKITNLWLNDVRVDLMEVKRTLRGLCWQLGDPMQGGAALTKFEAKMPSGRPLSVWVDCRDARTSVREAEKGSIGIFLYQHDGSGEGGSGLRFLGPGGSPDAGALVDCLMEKLCDQALVATDGSNGDFRFLKQKSFERYGRFWQPLHEVVPADRSYRATWLWRAVLIGSRA